MIKLFSPCHRLVRSEGFYAIYFSLGVGSKVGMENVVEPECGLSILRLMPPWQMELAPVVDQAPVESRYLSLLKIGRQPWNVEPRVLPIYS